MRQSSRDQEVEIKTAINKIKNGQLPSYEVIYSTYHPLIFEFLKKKLSNDSVIAEDIAADTFNKFLLSIKGYNHINKAALRSYLFSIAVRLFIDYYRTLRKSEIVDVESETSLNLQTDPYIVETYCDRKIRKDLLYQAMEKLTPNYNRVITLYYFQQLSYKEIQAKLNIPEGTVKARLNRAKQILKVELEDLHPLYEPALQL
jgi:RNA polymerase sigma factor (sigma-70 family)